MRALIVDDEPVARKVLREELEFLDSTEVVGEAENGEAALTQINSVRPDVVFLDVQMPVMGGFEMLKHLTGMASPAVIMVTAYDEHAMRAFEAGAIDYLLKPVSPQRLMQAMERARKLAVSPLDAADHMLKLQKLSAGLAANPAKMGKIMGRLGQEYFLLGLPEILAFQADGDLTFIITRKQRYLATQNLRALEGRTKHAGFVRIHRNALVNIEHIRKLSMLSSQRWLLTLDNDQEFVVSKRQARNVHEVLHW